jgi:DNA-binding response OmpR family regulator
MRKKILIVDSAENVRQLLRMNLEKEDYLVLEAEDMESAWKIITAQHPDLIISEVFLSGTEGFELCRKLREDSFSNQTPFIFFTSVNDMLLEVRGLRAGANDFLVKSNTNRQELLLKIEVLLEQASERVATPANFERGFLGKLEDVNLVEILQLLYQSNKTGVLQVVNAQQVGRIFFKAGQIFDAELEGSRGIECIAQMAGWKDGIFKFHQEEIIREKKIGTATINLLLEIRRSIETNPNEN